MRALRLLEAVAIPLILTLSAACGSGPPTAPGRAALGFQFTVAPLEVLRPGGGVQNVGIGPFGTLHHYARLTDGLRFGGPVAVPADALVTGVDAGRIDFSGAGGFRFYLADLEDIKVTPGQQVRAGDIVANKPGGGQTPRSIRLGVLHPQSRLGFLNPARYGEDVLRASPPLTYFAEPLRSQLFAVSYTGHVNPPMAEDVPGRLHGFWYLASGPVQGSSDPAHRDNWLRFFTTYEWETPGAPTLRVAAPPIPHPRVGPWEASIDAGDPHPRTVGPSSGLVIYRLFPKGRGWGFTLLVQMTSETSVRAEVFDMFDTPNPTAFTSAARMYIR